MRTCTGCQIGLVARQSRTSNSWLLYTVPITNICSSIVPQEWSKRLCIRGYRSVIFCSQYDKLLECSMILCSFVCHRRLPFNLGGSVDEHLYVTVCQYFTSLFHSTYSIQTIFAPSLYMMCGWTLTKFQSDPIIIHIWSSVMCIHYNEPIMLSAYYAKRNITVCVIV